MSESRWCHQTDTGLLSVRMSGEEPKDMTANEEKELRRVYDYLANFSPKYKLRRRMQPLLDRKYKILQVRCLFQSAFGRSIRVKYALYCK